MQTVEELVAIITTGRKSVSAAQAHEWAYYLSQLNGCKLFSVAAQEEDPDGWLRARTHGIGGSDIATIMDENPWSSPRKIWMSKLNMFQADKQPTQSEAARWGNLLEPVVANEWALRNSKQWIHIPVTLQSEEMPWMLANVDGFVLTNDRKSITGILEIKTTTAYNEDAWKEGPLPYYYLCQTNWYCGICGLSEYDIVCLVGGQHLYGYHLLADPVFFMREKSAAQDFWENNVLKGIEPKLTGNDLQEQQEKEFSDETPPAIYNDEDSERVVNSYIELRDKISALDKVKKALYAQLYTYMGTSTEGIIGEHTLQISRSERRSADLNRLAHDFPEAYAACVSSSIVTSLRIK